jgi:hypothetical protein
MNDLTADLRKRIWSRWPTRDSFYAARDDRTVRVAGLQGLAAYAERPVEIHIDPAALHDVTVQRIALVAANLTVRWARRVRLVTDGDADLHESLKRNGLCTLVERLVWEMTMADPFGDSSAFLRPIRLFVGPWCGLALDAEDYQVYAAHWCAMGRRGADGFETRTDVSSQSEATVAAAALAGSLGAADLFKRAVGHAPSTWMRTFAWDTWSSQLTLGENSARSVVARPVPETLELGRTLLAGVGAIGSAMLYMIDLAGVSGHLTLLDRDSVDVTNLNRSPLFMVPDAYDEVLKTHAGMAWLATPVRIAVGLDVKARHGAWRDHMDELAGESFDIWVSLTNEDGAWADVPFELPPVVLHGTTTSGWGFGAGRHIPRMEDCTLCRMPRPETVFRGPCAEGEIVPPSENLNAIRASLPFLSAASSALVVANMLQLQCGGPSAAALPNHVAVDLRLGLPAVIAQARGPSADCSGCGVARTRAWTTRGGRGRYATLSR